MTKQDLAVLGILDLVEAPADLTPEQMAMQAERDRLERRREANRARLAREGRDLDREERVRDLTWAWLEI